MRRLLPWAGTDLEVDLDVAYAHPSGCVRGLMVASVDGGVRVGGSSAALSGPVDRAVLTLLRGLSDVVLVGAQTVRTEGWRPPRPSAQRRQRRRTCGLAPVPAYAVVSRSGDVPLGPAEGNVLVLSGEPAEVLEQLAERGLTRVLCEGGPGWLAQLATAGLLSELCLTISPRLVGPDAGRVVEGPPWEQELSLRLTQLLEDDGWLFARYAVEAKAG